MSRTSYKGVKIDFGEDECARQLPARKKLGPQKANQAKTVPTNRFGILAVASGNDEEDSSDDGTEKESSDGGTP